MRVLCVGAAVLFMVCSSSAFSQIQQSEEMKFTPELPEGVPDSTVWAGDVGVMSLNLSNPIAQREEKNPFATWTISLGICPYDTKSCTFKVHTDSSVRIDKEAHTFEHVVRMVVRNESGKLAECLGYWIVADNIVKQQSFWVRSGEKWRKRTNETRDGMDVLLKEDVFVSLRVAALLKKIRPVKPE